MRNDLPTEAMQAARSVVLNAINGLPLHDAEWVINEAVLAVYRTKQAAAQGVVFDASKFPDIEVGQV